MRQIGFVLLVVPFFLFAEPSPVVIKEFKKSFKNQYESGQCFENTQNFLNKVVSLTNHTWYLVSVENKGSTSLGMVNVEIARTSYEKPEERNWYHHVFALDEEGFVYDLDFTNDPRIVPLKTYLEEMFLIEEECQKPRYGEICGGRDRKLQDYEFTLNRAPYALKEKIDPQQEVLSMQDLLQLELFH